MIRSICLIAAALGVALMGGAGAAGGGYEITSFTVAGGGDLAQDQWTLSGTVGQHEPGPAATGDTWSLHGGFWPAGGDVATCLADIDGDGDVGVNDLLGLLAAWGPCPPPCPPDLDGNGDVTTADLLDLLAAWGPCP